MLTADDVRTRTFSSSKFRQQGYDVRQVDDFLDRVTAAFEYYETAGALGKRIHSDEVRSTRFQTTKFRLGYQAEAVDAFLAEVEQALLGLEKAHATGQ